MINALETYDHMGRKAAKCRRQHDEAGARFYADWALRALALEAPADRPAARAAYSGGYRTEGCAAFPHARPEIR